jgi:16S rRNA (cytosine1402-N4)-methyltransferase
MLTELPAHRPVMLDEVVATLSPGPGRTFVDVTVGLGGHAEALLATGATVMGLDRDAAALAQATRRLSRFGARFSAAHASFRELGTVLAARGLVSVDGLLADLGVGSHQLDAPSRGFSFQRPGPLDMRMDERLAPLSEHLAAMTEVTLGEVLWRFGEVPRARRVARAILDGVRAGTIGDTAALAETIARAQGGAGRRSRHHPATRAFQALRILVNDETQELASLLAEAPRHLAPRGRLAVIAFHSLEDRAVKRAFRQLAAACACPGRAEVCTCGAAWSFRLPSRRAVKPADDEIARNPRSRSARLRVLQRRASAARE